MEDYTSFFYFKTDTNGENMPGIEADTLSHNKTEDEKRNRRKSMSQLSEKELSVLNDLLADEELLVKKFKMLATHTEDAEIKEKYEKIARQHQGHFDALYAYL